MKTRKNRNYRFLKFISLAFFIGSIFMACTKDKNTTKILDGSANLMAVNASPDAKPADFYWGDTKMTTTALSYGDHSNYVITPSGTRKAEFRSKENNAVLASADLNLVDKTNYTAFLAGNVATANIVLVADDLTAPAAGRAKVRFVNLSPDETKLDIRVIGGNKVAVGRDYKSVSNFIEVDPGVVKYEVLNNQDNSTVLFNMPDFTFDAGKIYTIWIKGTSNGTGESALGANILEHNK